MKTYSQQVAESIAKQITRRTRKRFSSLHANALGEIMSTPTSSNSLNANASASVRVQVGREQTVADQGRYAEPTSPAIGKDGVTQGMERTSQVGPIVVKPVDFKSIAGSYAGDHRAQPGDTVKAALDKIAAPPPPREAMRGQQNSKNYLEDGSGFRGSEFASQEAK